MSSKENSINAENYIVLRSASEQAVAATSSELDWIPIYCRRAINNALSPVFMRNRLPHVRRDLQKLMLTLRGQQGEVRQSLNGLISNRYLYSRLRFLEGAPSGDSDVGSEAKAAEEVAVYRVDGEDQADVSEDCPPSGGTSYPDNKDIVRFLKHGQKEWKYVEKAINCLERWALERNLEWVYLALREYAKAEKMWEGRCKVLTFSRYLV